MGKDVYEFYRVEARELVEGLGHAVLAIERHEDDAETLRRLLRFAHTLKGASRVVKQIEVAEIANALEDVFAPHREVPGAVPPEDIDRALRLLDAATAKISALDAPAPGPNRGHKSPEPLPARAAPVESFETVRVEIKELDVLLQGLAESSAHFSALRRQIEQLERARGLAESLLHRMSLPGKRASMPHGGSPNSDAEEMRIHMDELRACLEQAEREMKACAEHAGAELAQLRDRVSELRLVQASSIFGLLERAARDAAQSLRKEVSFESSGGETRLDAHVLATLRGALLHVVRNSVAHGIEPQAERTAAGKPKMGRVSLAVERRGNLVAFLCSDDGLGVDVEAIRRAAVRQGRISSAEASSLGLEQAVQLLMRGGVTTAAAVNEVSGRGIGLDVVREAAERLRGTVAVRSEAGRGMTIEICAPVSLSSLPALEIAADETVAAVPLSAVRSAIRVTQQDVAHSAGTASVLYEGQAIPFLPLREILANGAFAGRIPDTPSSGSKRQGWPAIVLQQNSRMAAIGVDRLLGATTAVVEALPVLAPTESFVSGVSRNLEGDLQLLLDPEALIARAFQEKPAASQAAAARRISVLVTDDSLTTRMLEQSILESAGYHVDLATSAEEGLEKARAGSYDVFLVDVEMPGMNGFEFVARTRADAHLSRVPAILVTSCNAPEDRRRAEEVGARGYIVKGEFDQMRLLRLIRELVGE